MIASLRAELGIPEGRSVVVYLGLLAEYQGITHLLRAAQLLVGRGLDVHFLVMEFVDGTCDGESWASRASASRWSPPPTASR